jgi:hypothetical protein
MKIKLKTRYAGPRGCFEPDTVLDLPPADAKLLVDGGYAVDVSNGTANGSVTTRGGGSKQADAVSAKPADKPADKGDDKGDGADKGEDTKAAAKPDAEKQERKKPLN